MTLLQYPIDENGTLLLELEPLAEHNMLRARLRTLHSNGAKSPLVTHLLPLISLAAMDGGTAPPLSHSEWDMPLPPAGTPFVLAINGISFAKFEIQQDRIQSTTERTLSVFETRMIGRAPQTGVPYPLKELGKFPGAITDLHTHLSAQVSSRSLIELGCRHAIPYPTAALDRLGINYPKNQLVTIPKRVFLPLAHLNSGHADTEPAIPLDLLPEESLRSLQYALSLSPETQSTFEAIETCYYLREPFTKDLRLLPDILRQVAGEYQKQGIRYAELSSNAVLDPQWLKVIHDALPNIERDTGVALRFLAGLPRNLNEKALNARIEQIKHVSASPYVVGVDVLGYEMNKTSHLHRHLKELAAWMHEHQPEMILRIHAGENPKNPKNVNESLQLAQEYNIRLRIGHALHGISDETLALAQNLGKEGRLIVEFNPDSNLAGNNIDFPGEVPILPFLHAGVPCVLASDGASLYGTSSRQTAMAGLFCGVTPNGFDFIHRTELSHIAEQQKIFDAKMQALPSDFFEKFAIPKQSTRPDQKPSPSSPSATEAAHAHSWSPPEGKIPIFIGGTAGSRWNLLKPGDRQHIVNGIKSLLRRLDPEHVCFVIGRTKDRGVGIELGKAIAEYNGAHDAEFDCTMLIAEGENGTSSRPAGINHQVSLGEPLVFLPNAILPLIKQHGGLAYFIGGVSFTRDFIVEAQNYGIPFGLVANIPGASAEKAKIYPQNQLGSVHEIAGHIAAVHPQIVRAATTPDVPKDTISTARLR